MRRQRNEVVVELRKVSLVKMVLHRHNSNSLIAYIEDGKWVLLCKMYNLLYNGNFFY
jgi:hypothetical protein